MPAAVFSGTSVPIIPGDPNVSARSVRVWNLSLQTQVYECKWTSVRGPMFEKYLTASTKISPVAEPTFPTFLFVAYRASTICDRIKRRIPSNVWTKDEEYPGVICWMKQCVRGSLETSLGSHKWSVPLRLNGISRRNHVTPRELSSDICNRRQGFVSYRGNHYYVPSVASWFLNYDRSNYY